MSTIKPCDLPTTALLRMYSDKDAFTDGYCIEVGGEITLAKFVAAFYTTPLFKLERFILKWLAGRPSTDEQAAALAIGRADTFAARQVEARNDNQLLVAAGRTRSWFMVEAVGVENGAFATRLYFGSSVVAKSGAPRWCEPVGFTARLPEHRHGRFGPLGCRRLPFLGLVDPACTRVTFYRCMPQDNRALRVGRSEAKL